MRGSAAVGACSDEQIRARKSKRERERRIRRRVSSWLEALEQLEHDGEVAKRRYASGGRARAERAARARVSRRRRRLRLDAGQGGGPRGAFIGAGTGLGVRATPSSDGAWRAAAGLCESPLIAGKGTALTGGSRTAVREGGGRAELGRERETGRLDWASRGRKER